eukprot:TRINITY_DN6055_c0_g1_i2.p2 TRINITY_DN6055_c0_g1~~TRINITY_DN6055_c0_g1_i2.p2  ORF type:complete len:105 (-),score=15.95 TRINITY_DN6055_c0_g1_i2:440-754(-)
MVLVPENEMQQIVQSVYSQLPGSYNRSTFNNTPTDGQASLRSTHFSSSTDVMTSENYYPPYSMDINENPLVVIPLLYPLSSGETTKTSERVRNGIPDSGELKGV